MRVIRRIFGASWYTSIICVVAIHLAIAVDVVMEYGREGLMNELLYADDFVLIIKSIENWGEKFFKSRDI